MNKPQILVIDDERGIREGCKRALTPQGFFVETAENGEEGRRKIETGNIDLALIDVMMPGTSGIDLISIIHQYDPEIVCIIITGYATVELAVRAIKQGAYDFLTKPFTIDDLQLVVNRGLERRRLSLEARRLNDIEREAQQLTEEKNRLEELDKAKVAFIRLVTHEMKAPISAILTYLDLMINGYIPPDEYNETLERARERAKEQLDLISDLLEFGKLKEIASGVPSEPLQMDDILQQVLAQLKVQAVEKGISIEVSIEAGLGSVCIDIEQAKSIWTNLISNAIKYTPSPGSVWINLTQRGEMIFGQVKDTGIGIPDEAKTRLFSEFFRAKNAKDLNISGTGLGLAIVRQIIEKAGGKIWAESEAGKGATFTFSLPIEK
jgi:two-component system sensor histidine kinase/response regulator